MFLLLNMLSKLVITFLPRSKCLLISWLQSPSAVILEPPPKKSGHKVPYSNLLLFYGLLLIYKFSKTQSIAPKICFNLNWTCLLLLSQHCFHLSVISPSPEMERFQSILWTVRASFHHLSTDSHTQLNSSHIRLFFWRATYARKLPFPPLPAPSSKTSNPPI